MKQILQITQTHTKYTTDKKYTALQTLYIQTKTEKTDTTIITDNTDNIDKTGTIDTPAYTDETNE